MIVRRYRWLLILAVPLGFVLGVLWGLLMTGGDLFRWGEYILSLGYFGAFIAALAALGLYLGVELGDRRGTRAPRSRVILAGVGALITVFTAFLLIGLSALWVSNPGYNNPLLFILMTAIIVAPIAGVLAMLGAAIIERGPRPEQTA